MYVRIGCTNEFSDAQKRLRKTASGAPEDVEHLREHLAVHCLEIFEEHDE